MFGFIFKCSLLLNLLLLELLCRLKGKVVGFLRAIALVKTEQQLNILFLGYFKKHIFLIKHPGCFIICNLINNLILNKKNSSNIS